MASPTNFRRSLRGNAISAAYTLETGIRDWFTRRATRRGWTPAVIPYPGYASATTARVLGRVVLAPTSINPATRRGIPGWRRLLTLEIPHTEVRITIGGTTTVTTTNEAGIFDTRVTLDFPLVPGVRSAQIQVADRGPEEATLHVVNAEPVRGVICDIDDTVWITGISHPLKAVWRTLSSTSRSRKSVPGMARLLNAAIAEQTHPAVVYLSNGPWNLAGPVSWFLKRCHFPAGAILMTDWGITPTRWFRDGKEHKSSSLTRLMDDFPHITWVLIGDDGEHDPDLYRHATETHPDRIAAIVLRQVDPARTNSATDVVNGVPILSGADGDELLLPLRKVLTERAPDTI